MCLRGGKEREGRFCCCSTFIGMHMAGLISSGLLTLYFFLMIRSSQNDDFNWMILVWIIAIGVPRVIFWMVHCIDSIPHRRNYAFALIFTTMLDLIIFGVNQFIIFTNNDEYCSRVYPVTYMVVNWDIYCNWAITIYDVCTSMLLTFYIYASIGALDHYYMGFLNPRLEAKELFRRQKILKE